MQARELKATGRYTGKKDKTRRGVLKATGRFTVERGIGQETLWRKWIRFCGLDCCEDKGENTCK